MTIVVWVLFWNILLDHPVVCCFWLAGWPCPLARTLPTGVAVPEIGAELEVVEAELVDADVVGSASVALASPGVNMMSGVLMGALRGLMPAELRALEQRAGGVGASERRGVVGRSRVSCFQCGDAWAQQHAGERPVPADLSGAKRCAAIRPWAQF